MNVLECKYYLKHVNIESSHGLLISVDIIEQLATSETIFTWPSAFVLAAYIVTIASDVYTCNGILELGAGTGLPSIVAAKINKNKITITERAENKESLLHLQSIVTLNQLDNAKVVGLL